jgi:ribonucleotide reductase beta subunit family protein with ferritin-like domain
VIYFFQKPKIEIPSLWYKLERMSANYCFLNDPLHKERMLPFPIVYSDIYDFYLKHWSTLWNETEVGISEKDRQDWNSLSSGEKHFLANVLTFFAKSDELVIENLNDNFLHEVTVPEAKMFYTVQSTIESVHNNMYSILLNYFLTKNEVEKAFHELQHLDVIKKKRDWVYRWMNPELPLPQRLIAFAIIEGIFFSGSFCAIYWVQSRKENFLEAICKSNEFIARDEGLHTDFACFLYRNYMQDSKLDQDLINSIMEEAVQLEIDYVEHSLPVKLQGMNSELMSLHIKFCSNELMANLGHEPIWPEVKSCPFEFMDKIAMSEKANFFESMPTSYSRKAADEDEQFKHPIIIDEEFH